MLQTQNSDSYILRHGWVDASPESCLGNEGFRLCAMKSISVRHLLLDVAEERRDDCVMYDVQFATYRRM
jgi:hypothetical protein